MKYELIHRTRYMYDGIVTVSHHLARLAPRQLPSQRCPWHELSIFPVPVGRGVRADSFGNTTTYFEIEGSHEEMEVTASSLVEVFVVEPPVASATPGWEAVRDACGAHGLNPSSAAGCFRYASPMVPLEADFLAYGRGDFPAGRPVLEGALALMRRIHRDFRFDPRATDVATPVMEVYRKRAGVCQDFAHFMLACLRSVGVPARYVSGYLETAPPEGMERLTGADASHAWVSVFCGEEAGWVDLDPTNELMPGERHVTVAWGRDFSDVSPLRGVTLGAGGQTLQVAVDVIPLG